MPLTVLDIKQAKPADKPYRLYDEKGMYLEVSPSGGKLFRLKYRVDGKEKRLALGGYPDTSLAEAREKRDEARKLVAQGIDPSAERQEAKRQRAEANQAAADTFEAVTREWMTREQERVAEVTANKNRWLFETFLFPEIGGLPLAAITPRVLLDALRKIEAAGKQETARRAKIKAGQVFRFAILEGKVDNDPTAALRGAIKRVKHKHHAAITDPAKIGQLLRDIDGFTGQPVTHAALKLAPLVFVRPGELRGADWSEIDFDGAMWRIPAARMKMKADHLVPLSAQAIAILRDLHPLTGHGRYVFPSLRGASRQMSENTVNIALRGLGYDGDTMTGHGFRAMASSRLNEMGWDERAIERQLAHAEPNEVKGAYNYAAKYLEDRKRMMQAWADYLDGLRAGGQVIAFKSKAG
ncbi:tyrosine-type recombinase/integrase [Dyella caseinilytica]|uniref:Integrase arm-type DNA-binding domain-containing protein n=2 Tax=Gammaproteobacteria TaxID=1236 RepID=A0ABX7H070_9GAMM|nr:integrase arm-type DNA-binding domain-containing protein [Dyella caseinilytica]QRN55302.1 integrase arm-type DNA-binding domain-containing protein [Dyella caseinilytica]GGA00838.1 integrase [Dyella caseinilytica]